jgi:hypothetical protein
MGLWVVGSLSKLTLPADRGRDAAAWPHRAPGFTRIVYSASAKVTVETTVTLEKG